MLEQSDVGLFNKIIRFHRYLREEDAKAMLEYGHTIFQPLAESIDEIFHVSYRKEHEKKALLGRGAEDFAWKLGTMIQQYGEKLARELAEKNFGYCNTSTFNRNEFIRIGKILQVGWEVMYFNQD